MQQSLKRVGYTLAIIAAFGLLGLSPQSPSAYATKVLKNKKDPIQLQLANDINLEITEDGSPVEATVVEDHEYKGQILPAGTIFRGTIEKIKNSRYIYRPGYVVFDFTKAKLPNGVIIDLETDDKKIHGPDAMTMTRGVKIGGGYTLSALAVKLPLQIATPLPGLVTTPLGFAGRMTYGVITENIDAMTQKPDKDHVYRTGWGIWRGTMIPGTYRAIFPSPDPVFKEGEYVSIYIDKDSKNHLFEMSNREYQPLLNVSND